jgi:hypothetical protein
MSLITVALTLLISPPADPLEGWTTPIWIWRQMPARPASSMNYDALERSLRGTLWHASNGELTLRVGPERRTVKYTITKKDKNFTIDFEGQFYPHFDPKKKVEGLIEVRDEAVLVAFGHPGAPRPTSMETPEKFPGFFIVQLRRVDCGKESPVLAASTGNDGRLETPRYERIRRSREMNTLWIDLLGDEADRKPELYRRKPAPDFGKEELICIVQGNRQNCNGLYVREVDENDERIRIRYDQMSYQTVNRVDEARPFLLLTVRQSKKPIVVEENVQSLIHGPPKWKERARLPM